MSTESGLHLVLSSTPPDQGVELSHDDADALADQLNSRPAPIAQAPSAAGHFEELAEIRAEIAALKTVQAEHTQNFVAIKEG